MGAARGSWCSGGAACARARARVMLLVVSAGMAGVLPVEVEWMGGRAALAQGPNAAGAGAPVGAADEDAGAGSPVFVNQSPSADDGVRRLDELLRGKSLDQAVVLAVRLLEDESAALLAAEGDARLFVPARARVLGWLERDGEFRARFRALRGGLAQEALGRGEVEGVARGAPVTAAGLEAELRLAEMDLEAGRFGAALRRLEGVRTHDDLTGEALGRAAEIAREVARFEVRGEGIAREFSSAAGGARVEGGAGVRARPERAELPTSPLLGEGAGGAGAMTARGGALARIVPLPIASVQIGPTATIMPHGWVVGGINVDTLPLRGRELRVMPVVRGDAIFVQREFAVMRLDARTLETVWRRDPLGPALQMGARRTEASDWEDVATPTVVGGKGGLVLATLSTESGGELPEQELVALDAETGAKRWSVAPGVIDPSIGPAIIRGPILVDGDTVVVGLRKRLPERRLVALYLAGLEVTTGRTKWSALVGSSGMLPWPANSEVVDAGVIENGIVYRADRLGTLSAHDAATGAPLWVRTLPTSVNGGLNGGREMLAPWQQHAPVVIGGSVFTRTPDGSAVVRVDARSGRLLGSMGSAALGNPSYLLRAGERLAAVGAARVAVIAAAAFGKAEEVRLSGTVANPGIRGRVVVVGKRLMVPTVQGVLEFEAERPEAAVRRVGMDEPGNVGPPIGERGGALLATDDAYLHLYGDWELARALLTAAVKERGTDAEPAAHLLEVAARIENVDGAIEAVELAAVALAAEEKVESAMSAAASAENGALRPDGVKAGAGGQESEVPAQDVEVARKQGSGALGRLENPSRDEAASDEAGGEPGVTPALRRAAIRRRMLEIGGGLVERVSERGVRASGGGGSRAGRQDGAVARAATLPGGADAALLERARVLVDELARLDDAPGTQATALLLRAGIAEAVGDDAGALESVQRVLDEDRLAGAVVSIGGRTAAAEALSAERVERIVARAGRGVYAESEARAAAALAALRGKGAAARPGEFEALARRYPAARAGAEIWLAAARAFERAGDARAAARSAEQGLSAAGTDGDIARVRGELAGGLVLNLKSRGLIAAAVEAAARVRARNPEVVLTYEGAVLDGAVLGGELAARLSEVRRGAAVGEVRVEGRTLLSGWALLEPLRQGGAESGNGFFVMRHEDGRVALFAPGRGVGAAGAAAAKEEGGGVLAPLWATPAGAGRATLVRQTRDAAVLIMSGEIASGVRANGQAGGSGASVVRVSVVREGPARVWTSAPIAAMLGNAGGAAVGRGGVQIIATAAGNRALTDVVTLSDERTVVLVERSGRAVALDLETGAVRWSAQFPITRIVDAVLAAGALVIVGEAPPDAAAGGGGGAWQPAVARFELERGGAQGAPVRLEERARWVRATERGEIVLGLEGSVRGLDAADLRELWALTDHPAARAIDAWIAGPSAVLMGEDMQLYLVNAADGAALPQPLDARGRVDAAARVLISTRARGGFAVRSSKGIALFDEKGVLAGLDALDAAEGQLAAAPIEGGFLTVSMGAAPSRKNPYTLFNLMRFEGETGALRASTTLALGTFPMAVAAVDGYVAVTTQNHHTLLYAAPVAPPAAQDERPRADTVAP
ncbi:hypothetical protein BH11PLA1_BH11PLA1_23030 [soil metagenome]